MRLRIVISIFFLTVAFFPTASFAALDLGTGRARQAAGEAGYDQNTGVTTFSATLGRVVKGFLSVVGVIFLTLMVYAGFLWMTARGAEDQITKAQDIIRAAVIGLIITVGAYSITSFVVPRIISRTTGQGTTQAEEQNEVGTCAWTLEGGSGSESGVQDENTCRVSCGRFSNLIRCTFNGVEVQM